MWYLKDITSGKVVTTISVGYDPKKEISLIHKDQLEMLDDSTKGIPILFTLESDVSLYIEECKKYRPEWKLKSFKLIEMEWE